MRKGGGLRPSAFGVYICLIFLCPEDTAAGRSLARSQLPPTWGTRGADSPFLTIIIIDLLRK